MMPWDIVPRETRLPGIWQASATPWRQGAGHRYESFFAPVPLPASVPTLRTNGLHQLLVMLSIVVWSVCAGVLLRLPSEVNKSTGSHP